MKSSLTWEQAAIDLPLSWPTCCWMNIRSTTPHGPETGITGNRRQPRSRGEEAGRESSCSCRGRGMVRTVVRRRTMCQPVDAAGAVRAQQPGGPTGIGSLPTLCSRTSASCSPVLSSAAVVTGFSVVSGSRAPSGPTLTVRAVSGRPRCTRRANPRMRVPDRPRRRLGCRCAPLRYSARWMGTPSGHPVSPWRSPCTPMVVLGCSHPMKFVALHLPPFG